MLSSYLLVLHSLLYLPFFFTRPATTEIYTLSLHDALPISALEGRSQHARRARRRLLLRRPTGVHAAESRHRDARGIPHPGIEGRSGRDRIDAELGAANRQGQLPQLLHGQLPPCDAGGVSPEVP